MKTLITVAAAVGLFVFMAAVAGSVQAMLGYYGHPIDDVAARGLGAAGGVALVLSIAAWRAKK